MAPRVSMPAQDWTLRAPKWAAVALLGVLCAVAIAIGSVREYRSWRPATLNQSAAAPGTGDALAERTESAPALPSSEPAGAVEIGAKAKPGEARDDARAPASTRAPNPSAIPNHRVNLNTASAPELELLPGIGPALARRIIEHRTARGPFKRLADLDAVKGIGPKLLERIKPYAVVE